MKEYEKHIRSEKYSNINRISTSWCGEKLILEWVFQDSDHALNTILDEGRLLPCPKCKEKILEILNKNN